LELGAAVLFVGIGGLFLILGCLRRLWRLKARGEEETLAYCVLQNGLRSLVPVVAVIGLYYLAFAYVRYSDSVSLDTLAHIQDRLESLRRLVDRLNLNPVVLLLVLVVVYCVVTIGLSQVAWRRLTKGIKAYRGSTGLASGIVMLLTSFTLLGSLPGKPQLTVALKVARINEQYGTIRKEVESKLTQQVAEQLLQKTYEAFPAWYRDSLDLPSEIATAKEDLAASYTEASAKYGIKDASVEDVLTKYATSAQGADPAHTAGETGSPKDEKMATSSRSGGAPGNTTMAEVENARIALARTPSEASPPESVKGSAREIALQLPGVLMEPGHDFLSTAFPQWKPVIDTVLNTVSDSFKERLEKAIDAVMGSATKGRMRSTSLQADELVSKTPVDVSAETLAEALTVKTSLDNGIADLNTAATRLRSMVTVAELQPEAPRSPSNPLERLPTFDFPPIPRLPAYDVPLPEYEPPPIPRLPTFDLPPIPPPDPVPDVVIPDL
jgi:hypothetical protein